MNIIQQEACRSYGKQDSQWSMLPLSLQKTPAAVRERIAGHVNTVVNCFEMYAYCTNCLIFELVQSIGT
jgi:hypothetical protein